MINQGLRETDVLIIGAGIAGIRAAIEASDRGARVAMISKGLFSKDCGATWMAHNGYQCWGHSPDDTLDKQVLDTVKCGWFLNNQENVYAFLAHVPDTVRDLLCWGARHKMKEDGSFKTLRQLGASLPTGRSLSAATWPRGGLGFQYGRSLPRAVRTREIDVIEDTYIADLLTDGDTVTGAAGIDLRTGQFVIFRAKATILATGGYHGIYKSSTGNPNLTGDGQAMALRAGVDMMDFEFDQTLPCVIWPPALEGDKLPFDLIMDWDAWLYNANGERFMAKWEPARMERSTRALISRAIFHEIAAGRGSPHGGIYTSVSHNERGFLARQLDESARTSTFMTLKEAGIDLTKDAIETGYRIHYCQGGCNVNTSCETDKPGLYAAGEVASGGKDGGDRMMANALPFCMSMGIIAGREAARRAQNAERPQIDHDQAAAIRQRIFAPLMCSEGLKVYPARAEFYALMEKETSYGRTEEGLRHAGDEVQRYRRDLLPNLCVANKQQILNPEWVHVLEFANLVLVAECVITNALRRKESRGLHDRIDYPYPDPQWFKNIHLRLVDGELQQWTTPVEFTYWQPAGGSSGEPTSEALPVKERQGWAAEPLYKTMGAGR